MALQPTFRKVTSNITTLLVGSTASQGILAVVLLLTARELGANSYGIYASCFTVASLSSIVFSLGLDTWLLREGGRSKHTLGELVSTVLIIKLVFGCLWFVVLSLFFQWIDLRAFPPNIMRLSALTIWFDSLLLSLMTVFKSSLRNHLASLLGISTAIILFLVTLSLVIYDRQDIVVYIQARIGALTIGNIFAVALIWRLHRFHARASFLLSTLRHTLPFALSDLLAWTYMRVDVAIVAFTLGEYYVGLYAPAISVVNALFVVPGAVYGVMVPVLSHLFTTNISEAITTSYKMIISLFIVCLSMTVPLFCGANLLISFLGDSYQQSIDVLRILSLVLVFKGVTFGVAAILVATGEQVRRTYVQTVVVIVNIFVNIGIVRIFGITGVALVYVMTESILMVGYIWQSKIALHRRFSV